MLTIRGHGRIRDNGVVQRHPRHAARRPLRGGLILRHRRDRLAGTGRAHHLEGPPRGRGRDDALRHTGSSHLRPRPEAPGRQGQAVRRAVPGRPGLGDVHLIVPLGALCVGLRWSGIRPDDRQEMGHRGASVRRAGGALQGLRLRPLAHRCARRGPSRSRRGRGHVLSRPQVRSGGRVAGTPKNNRK